MTAFRTVEKISCTAPRFNLDTIVGSSARMRRLYEQIRSAAPTRTTVLIEGESGTGKELVARTLHALSGRVGPLVVLDASVMDRDLIRSDLFGHVKGGYTGATEPRAGAFRNAHGGTLFIDEIGELPLDIQPRLLRVLENREVSPIGSDCTSPVDVRVIAATHRNLPAMVEDGEFRADLYYRLAVVPIRVPALREIPDDVPALVHHLIAAVNLPCRVSPAAIRTLQDYPWPGNVRELRNVLERAAVHCRGDEIGPEHLDLCTRTAEPIALPPAAFMPPVASLAQLRDLERRLILDAMARNHNNKERSARELGIPLSTLRRKLKAFAICN